MDFLSAGFNVGDRVQCVGVQDGKKTIVGWFGTIINIDSYGSLVSVEFDLPFPGGHSGFGRKRGKPGHCWDFSWSDTVEKLIHAEEYKGPIPEFDGLF